MVRTVVDERFTAEMQRQLQFNNPGGLSAAAIARKANVSPSHFSELINGRKMPSAQTAAALDRAFGAGGRLLELVETPLPDNDMDRFTAVTLHPHRVDELGVESLAQVLAANRVADDTLGSAALLGPVGAQMDQILVLAREARGAVRPKLIDVAGQWAQFAGWLWLSAGHTDIAQGWFRTGLEWATEANDPELIATVLSYQAHASWLSYLPGPTIGLSEAALRHDGVYPGQLAYDAYQAARGHAVLGDLEASDRYLDRGGELAEASNAFTGDTPPWQYYREPWQWQVEEGLVHRYAARHDPSRIGAAVDRLRAGTAAVPAGQQGSEWYAEYLVHLGQALITAGDRDEAGAVIGRARSIAEAVSASRVLQQVRAGERLLAAPPR